MKTLNILFALSFLALPLPAFAADAPSAKPSITISDAYSFAVPEGARSAAVFMNLTYGGGMGDGKDITPDRILHASTPAAGKSEIHTMSLDNNVMTMRPVESFPLPPTGSFAMKPNGVHVMLMDLKRPLKAGDKFPLTITFAHAGSVKVDVNVRAPGDVPEPDEEKAVHEDMKMDGMDHDMHHDMKP